MADIILRTEQLSKNFGGLIATNNVSLNFERGRVHAIIGPNGAGKTTLINQLSGDLLPSAGKIFFNERDITQLARHRSQLPENQYFSDLQLL